MGYGARAHVGKGPVLFVAHREDTKIEITVTGTAGEKQRIPIRRPGFRYQSLVLRGFNERLGWPLAVLLLPEDGPPAISIRLKRDCAAVRCPYRKPIVTAKGELPGLCAPIEVVHPDVGVLSLVDFEGKLSSVRRETGRNIAPWRQPECLDVPFQVEESEYKPCLRLCRRASEVRERTGARHASLSGTGRLSTRACHAFHDWNRTARRFKLAGIKRDSQQHASDGVDDVSRFDIPRVGPASDDRLRFGGPERLHDDLRAVPCRLTGLFDPRSERIQNRTTVGQQLRTMCNLVLLHTDHDFKSTAPIWDTH